MILLIELQIAKTRRNRLSLFPVPHEYMGMENVRRNIFGILEIFNGGFRF